MIFCIDISESDPRAFSGAEYLERGDRVIFFDGPGGTHQVSASIFDTIAASGCALEYVRSHRAASDAMLERVEPETDDIKASGQTVALIGSKKGIKKTANKLRSHLGSISAVTTAATIALAIAQCAADSSDRAKTLLEKTQSIYFEERYAATVGALKAQLAGLLSGETRETQNSAAAVIRASKSRHDVYLGVISRFGSERGREIYRAIRPELNALSAKLIAAPAAPADAAPQKKKKDTDPMHLRVASLLVDATDETVDGVIEILNACRERDKLCIALTKCFGQALGVEIYKKIRDNMTDIFPQKKAVKERAPQKRGDADPALVRVTELLPDASAETTAAAAALLRTCDTKQALYLGMIKKFGTERGRAIYRAVRGAQGELTPASPPKGQSELRGRVASVFPDTPDEVIDRIAEILKSTRDRQTVYLALTKEFGQKHGVTLYKSIRAEMPDIIPQGADIQNDQLKLRLGGLFKKGSSQDIDAMADILRKEKGRQAVYQKMVDRFGIERGRTIYRAIRKDLSDVMPKGG